MKSSGMFSNLWSEAIFAAICAVVLAPCAANAAEYVEGTTPEIVLMAGSEDGTTNTLAEAIAAYNTAHETSYDISSFNGGDLAAYALVKDGDGTLVMDTAIANFTGPVVIKDGVLKCDCTNALGADTTSSHVYVRDGATFYVKRVSDSENIKNNNRNLHVAGNGHNGQGALNVDKARKSNSYNPTGIYGKVLYLDGDATVVHPSWAAVANPVNLNGHTMVVKSADNFSSGSSYCNATYQVATLNGPGKMAIDDSIYYLQGTKLNDTTAGNEIEIRNNGGFRFWKSAYTGYNWTFRFTGETAWLFGDNSDSYMRFNNDGNAAASNYFAERNRIGSPVILEGTTLKMRTQSGIFDNWVFFTGPISGNGNINLECETWANFPAHRISLLNPANSFTGTATVDKGLLYIYEPGTLPSTVQLVVSRSHALNYKLQKTTCVPEYFGAEFLSPNPQTLNSLTFTSVKDGSAYHSGRIQGGSGTFSRIDKQSPNTMEYYSGIGSPLLNVEGGTVKLPRGPAPGLWEGTNSTVIGGALTGSAATTNLIARGPNILNNTLFPHYGARFGFNTSYTGYIWNRTGADATWTFAMSAEQYTRMDIDGVEVMRQRRSTSAPEGNDGVHKFQAITLTPGPHLVHIRCNASKLYCTTNMFVESGGTARWPQDFGFVFDKQGRSVDVADYPDGDYSAITNHFEVVLDPGDGSLFTRSIDEADLPHFNEMRFAAGTTLDLNGNAYVASTLSGLPNIVSTATDTMANPSLTITNRFVVNAGDLVADPSLKLSLAMPLSFGADAGVTVTNLAALARGTYTLAEVTGSGNVLTVADADSLNARSYFGGSKKWRVRVVDNKIELCPAPGVLVFIR
jgi:autotransporter-associated beta strand protein